MRTIINDVQCLFMGFDGHEDEMEQVREIAENIIEYKMKPWQAWNAIADAFDQHKIDNVIFSCSTGVEFMRVCSRGGER